VPRATASDPTCGAICTTSVATGVNRCAFGDASCGSPARPSYQPIWPFPDYAAASAWQTKSEMTGNQAWHLDANQTALGFVASFLRFPDVTRVTSSTVVGVDAYIGVGFVSPANTLMTAAVLHLVRYGPNLGDTVAGWEVVGTDDTDLSIDSPIYGTKVASRFVVGGHITGVDENIVVVPMTAGGVVVGPWASVSAGGDNSPWTADATVKGNELITIVAWTGGHVQTHERFAIHAVHS
jgi:hypothetical protein